ncbi:MAG: iron ABC transporter permease [Planctomycetota bacterium]|nr:iron ABC transporter permease [Planctomycetota bacterium]
MRSNADRVLATAITVAVVVFFLGTLVYPLGYALIEAVREPVTVMPEKGETWAGLAARVGVGEARLRALNSAAEKDTAPAGNRAVTVGWSLTARHLARIFDADAPQWRWIVNSLLLAGTVTACCAVISYPLAYLQARTTFWKQGLLGGLLLLPLVMPPFVGAIGLRRMLAKYGTVNLCLMDLGFVDQAHPIDFLDGFRLLGCVLVMVLHFYPLLYLNLAAAISNVDPALLESAKSLGLTPWQTFRRVVFPLSTPGLIAGGSLVFVGAFTDLGTPLIFGYQETVARQIYALANEQTSNPAAPALVAVVTAIVLVLFALMRWSVARGAAVGGVKGQSRSVPNRLSPGKATVAVVLHVAVMAVAIVPHVAVTLTALGQRWFTTALPESYTLSNMAEALGNQVAVRGMRNSLIYALASTFLDLSLGLACAWAIVRRGGWWGKTVDALSLAPLAIPGLVLAFGYVGAYAKVYSQPYYLAGVPLTGVGFFLILSYAVRRLPYVVRACAAGLEQTPRNLEEAGLGLGATPGAVIRRVTLPLITANVVAGAILAFSFAMLEVSDSIILATRPQDFPLTKAIYQLFGNPGNGDQLASALGVVALVFLTFSLLAAGTFLGKKWGEMFRG